MMMYDNLSLENLAMGILFYHAGTIADEAAAILEEADFITDAGNCAFRAFKKYGKNFNGYLLVEALNAEKIEVPDTDSLKYDAVYEVKDNPEVALDILKQLHNRRELERMRKDVLELLRESESESTTEDTAADLASKLDNIVNGVLTKHSNSSLRTWEEVANEWYNKYRFGNNKADAVQTDIPSLDRWLNGGFGKGDLITIAAATGVGKSTLAFQLAITAAEHGKKPLYFSLEMTDENMIDRMSKQFGLTTAEVKQVWTDETIRKAESFMTYVIELPKGGFLVDGSSSDINLFTIRSQAHKAKPDIIFVDYIQILDEYGEKWENEAIRLGRITRSLKKLAIELNIPVVILSQFNNEVYKSEKPMLSHLKGSGSIAQDSNAVILLWEEDAEKGYIGLNLAKNRNGERGELHLLFDKSKMTMREMVDYKENDPVRWMLK